MQALVQMMHDPNGSEIAGIDAQEAVQYIDVMAPTPDGGHMPAQPMRTYPARSRDCPGRAHRGRAGYHRISS